MASQDSARPSSETLALWRAADCVCFDVDSTVLQDEGINVLAEFVGAGDAVASFTKQAMSGGMLFQDALAARLDLMKPSKQQVEDCLVAHPPRLTDGIEQLVGELKARGKAVYLVSGGFERMIAPVAAQLKVDGVYANCLQFDADTGEFTGFDKEAFTSRTGGKPKVVQALKDKHGYKVVAVVGDGVTDMEARPPADVFIGFGGVAVRDKVRDGADWFVTEFAPLLAALAE